MTTYLDKDGNTHVIMRNGDHYVGRGSNIVKLAAR